MNYSGFKKVQEDEDKAVLKNQHGHSITISKKALSKKHHEELKRLPLHAAGGTGPIESDDGADNQTPQSNAPVINLNFGTNSPIPNVAPPAPGMRASQATGPDVWSAINKNYKNNGPVEGNLPNPSQEALHQAPAAATVPNSPMADQPQQPAEQASDLAPQEDDGPYSGTPMSDEQRAQHVDDIKQRRMAAIAGQPDDTAFPPAPQPEAPPQKTNYQQAYQDFVDAHQRAFAQEDAAYAHDLQNGHITPKTYGDLFASRSTLGKVGTLFGLLLSGAGSGITGQPNAVMEMMNNEIKNDLQSQIESKKNAYNYINLGRESLLNQAQITKYGEETKGLQIDNEIKNINQTRNRMMLGTLQHLTGITNSLPPQSQPAAIQALNGVRQAASAQIQQNNNQASQQLAQRQTESQYLKETASLRQMGLYGPEGAPLSKEAEYREKHYIPGVGTTTREAGEGQIDEIKKINNFQNLLQEATDLSDVLGRGGAWTPSQKLRAKRIRNDLVSSYNDVKGLNRFTKNEEELYDGIVPDVAKLNVTGAQRDLLEDLKSSVQAKKDLIYKTSGVNPFSDSKERQSGAPATIERVDSKGRTVIFDAKTKKALGWKK